MRLFFIQWFQNRRQAEPTVVEQPPAVIMIDEKLSEERLRYMFHLGEIAGYKQRKEEEEQKHRAEISSLKTLKPQYAQPVLQMPVQAVQKPVQQPIPINRRAGGWMHAEHARMRTAAKIGKHILPVRPRFHTIQTVAEMPIVRKHWPDAG